MIAISLADSTNVLGSSSTVVLHAGAGHTTKKCGANFRLENRLQYLYLGKTKAPRGALLMLRRRFENRACL